MAITITDVLAFADQWYTAIMKEHVGEQKQSEFFIIPSKAISSCVMVVCYC